MPQLTKAGIASACMCTEEFLENNGVDSRQIIRFQFGIEEVLLRYQEHFGSDAEFKMQLGKRLGNIMIRILIPGRMMDPFSHGDELDDVEQYMHNAMIRMGQLPVWHYEYGCNKILFTMSRKRLPEWIRLFIAIAAALICGLLVRLTPDTTRILLQDSIVAPLMNTFLGFLNAIAGPMIFLSVVWGIYSIGDASTFSVLGKKLTIRYGGYLTVMLLLTAIMSWPFFHLNFTNSEVESHGFSALYYMILDIVPTNLFTPFSRGNTLQILFIAIVVGITMIIIGEKSQLVASMAEQLSFIVNSIMGFVGKLVPYFVFGSLFNIIVGSDISLLMDAGKFFFGTVMGCVLVLIVHTAVSAVYNHISPALLWKRSISTFVIGLTTASSSAAFVDNINSCTEKHGVSPKLANFAVPFGQILYKPGTAIMYWFAAVSVAERNELAVSVPWIITVLVMCVVLSSATPPVPGGTTASFSILFVQLGLPTESLAIILALNVVQEFVRTATNLFGGQCVLLDASRSFGLNRSYHVNH